MKLTRRQQNQPGGPVASTRGGSSALTDLNRLRNEIDRLFEDPFSFAPTSFFEGETPKIDIYEDQDKITVQAELPGMKKEEIDISIEGDVLTISGERKTEHEEKQGEAVRSERYFGRFMRSITLPQPVKNENIQARYQHGILTVTCPKTEQAKRQRIEIQSS